MPTLYYSQYSSTNTTPTITWIPTQQEKRTFEVGKLIKISDNISVLILEDRVRYVSGGGNGHSLWWIESTDRIEEM